MLTRDASSPSMHLLASACLSIRQHTSAYADVCLRVSALRRDASSPSKHLLASAYVSIRQHTSAYADVCLRVSALRRDASSPSMHLSHLPPSFHTPPPRVGLPHTLPPPNYTAPPPSISSRRSARHTHTLTHSHTHSLTHSHPLPSK